MEKTPQQVAGVERLKRWAIGPEGQAIFRWGEDHDFARCKAFYRGKLPDHMIDGWCSNLHQLATGGRPGHSKIGPEAAEVAAKKAAKKA